MRGPLDISVVGAGVAGLAIAAILAKAGHRVVRLVAGDAALWSSVAEEASAVAKAGIGFEIVPGVSEAVAVPAYAGMPVATNDQASVAVVRCLLSSVATIDWASYSGCSTLVVLGSAQCLAGVASGLIEAGKPGNTPVSLTCRGTTTDQVSVAGTLESIVSEARNFPEIARFHLTEIVSVVLGALSDLFQRAADKSDVHSEFPER